MVCPGTINNILAGRVWEHLSPEDAVKACNNCIAYLKDNGLLRIAVPDEFHPDADYIARVKPGGYGPEADDHKFCLATARFLLCLKTLDTKSGCRDGSTSQENSTMRIGRS